MTAEPGSSEPGPDASVHDLRADIEATRGQLGDTVEALSAKLDVKQQAKQKVGDTKDLIADKVDTVRAASSERPVVPIAVVAVLVAAVGIVIWKRRR